MQKLASEADCLLPCSPEDDGRRKKGSKKGRKAAKEQEDMDLRLRLKQVGLHDMLMSQGTKLKQACLLPHVCSPGGARSTTRSWRLRHGPPQRLLAPAMIPRALPISPSASRPWTIQVSDARQPSTPCPRVTACQVWPVCLRKTAGAELRRLPSPEECLTCLGWDQGIKQGAHIMIKLHYEARF